MHGPSDLLIFSGGRGFRRFLNGDGHIIGAHLTGRCRHLIDEMIAASRANARLVERDLRLDFQSGTAWDGVGRQHATTHTELPNGRHWSTSIHSITQPGTYGRDGDAFGDSSNSSYSGLHTHNMEISGFIRGNDRGA
jgi:hypothetical protein